MRDEQCTGVSEPLETASELERAGIVKRACAYTLAKAGVIPFYLVGPKQTGVRFRRSEVLAALRRPARAEQASKDLTLMMNVGGTGRAPQ